MSSLANAGALSTAEGDPATLSRPFDAGRTGFIPAEGAAMLVLEPLSRAQERGAHVYATIASVAISCDAYHVTAPDPDGAGAELALRGALERSGMDATEIGAVIAHGTGTQLNDASEAAAVKRVLGAGNPLVTAPKAVLGHGLGAAGAFSVAIGALATCILIVNNLRDRVTDAKAGKRTLAVRFGAGFARGEYAGMLALAYAIPVWHVLTTRGGFGWLLPLLTMPLALRELVALHRKDGAALNPHLGGAARLGVVYGTLLAVGLCL
jgi:hypothetical protein